MIKRTRKFWIKKNEDKIKKNSNLKLFFQIKKLKLKKYWQNLKKKEEGATVIYSGGSTQVGVEKRAIKEENQTDIKPDRITIHMSP